MNAFVPVGQQKSAKPKAKPQGDRDFEAVRRDIVRYWGRGSVRAHYKYSADVGVVF